jgi:hypothetical protein
MTQSSVVPTRRRRGSARYDVTAPARRRDPATADAVDRIVEEAHRTHDFANAAMNMFELGITGDDVARVLQP